MGIKIGKAKSTRFNANTAKSRRSVATDRISLVDALFSTTQKRLLALIFGQPERSFFATELIQLTGSGSGGVQRELHRLIESGLVTATKLGNQKHVQANRSAPIYEELHSIVTKTLGIAEPFRAALAVHASRIEFAAIFGSVAKQADVASSDVDLLIVSDDLALEEVYSALQPTEQRIARKINPLVLTGEEFGRRRGLKGSFVQKILSGDIVVLIGNGNGANTL